MRRLIGTLAAIAILPGALGAVQAQGYRPPRGAEVTGAGAPRIDNAGGMLAGFVFLNFSGVLWVPNQLITLTLLWRYTEAPPPPEMAAPLMDVPEGPGAELAQEPPNAPPEEATTEIVPEPGLSASPATGTTMAPVPRPERAVEEAIAGALADSAEGVAPDAPPLSADEKDAFRLAVLQCWNVGSLSVQAQNTSVVVSVSLNRDGRPEVGSIRMLDYRGGNDVAARQAYEAARRAIIRCGATGYELPIPKYQRWREIEITFNPERMRIE